MKGAYKELSAELQTMLQNKIDVELELMRRRHELSRKYCAEQLVLQQGAEIAALQLRQNIAREEMRLLARQQTFRGKPLLLPNVDVAFGVQSIDHYGPTGLQPAVGSYANPVQFDS